MGCAGSVLTKAGMRAAVGCVGGRYGCSYRLDQVLAVGLVTAGVLLVTAGTVHDNGGRAAAAAATVGLDSWRQLEAWIGIAMLVGAMFVSGYLGAVQETVFSEYGKLSDEAVFYLVRAAYPSPGVCTARHG